MSRTIRPLLAFVIVAACGAPASVGPGSEPAPPEGRAPTPVESLAFEVEAPEVATEPPAAPEAAVSVTELAAATAPDGSPLADRPAARLVPLGGSLRGYAGGIASRVRRAMRPTRVRSARPGAAGSAIGIGEVEAVSEAAPTPSPAVEARAAPPAEPAAGTAESVTNVQVAGVDEGGIVKAWRDFLIVLRRGRLFTIHLGDAPGAARPVAGLDVRPPNIPEHDAWYDEMLIHDATGTIVVIGFSYDDEATEIGLFRIAPDGTLTHRGTHLLRSNDYYSSRNYASRLVGDTLVFYMPHYLVMIDDRVSVSLPSTKPLGGGSWRSIVTDAEVYRISGVEGAATLHTVVACDLGAPRFGCRARGILGGEGRTFFVSRDAVYVWVMPEEPIWTRYDYSYDDENEQDEQAIDPSELPSHLFRLPLDGSRPSALVVRGAPIDQFSFNETAQDLWVLVQAEGSGDAMWGPEVSSGALGLARIPLSAFTADAQDVRVLAPAAYRTLPSPVGGPGRSGTIQNRFVGDYLLYGEGVLWGRREPGSQQQDQIFLHRTGAGRTFVAALPSGADRIEALGSDAVVIGTDGADLHFRAFALDATPVAAGAYVQQGAAQGETRSHGFFYRPTGERQGILGLPTTRAGRAGVRQLVEGSAAVLYLAVDQLAFAQLGELRAEAANVYDRCEVSCTDWYGNARPLFYRGRVFALLGYELVEGRIENGAITEVARASMLAALPPDTGRPLEVESSQYVP